MAPIVGRSHRDRGGRDGAIAQLGERVVRNDEVGGSIPPGSTSLRSLRELRLGKPRRSFVAKRAKAAASQPSWAKTGCSWHSQSMQTASRATARQATHRSIGAKRAKAAAS